MRRSRAAVRHAVLHERGSSQSAASGFPRSSPALSPSLVLQSTASHLADFPLNCIFNEDDADTVKATATLEVPSLVTAGSLPAAGQSSSGAYLGSGVRPRWAAVGSCRACHNEQCRSPSEDASDRISCRRNPRHRSERQSLSFPKSAAKLGGREKESRSRCASTETANARATRHVPTACAMNPKTSIPGSRARPRTAAGFPPLARRCVAAGGGSIWPFDGRFPKSVEGSEALLSAEYPGTVSEKHSHPLVFSLGAIRAADLAQQPGNGFESAISIGAKFELGRLALAQGGRTARAFDLG